MQRWLLLVALAGVAGAVQADDREGIRALVQSGRILPLQTLLQEQAELRQARILEVELEREHGRYVYEIEILQDNGRVDELEIDAASGEILRRKREH